MKKAKAITKEIIKEHDWTKIITRPFTLFGASIWNEWYASEQTKEIFGVNLSHGLFIEHPKGMVRHYRDKKELEKVKKILKDNLTNNPEKYELLLREGVSINKEAKLLLKNKQLNSVEDAVNFLTKLALLSTILPYMVGELTEKRRFIRKLTLLSMMLRGVSLYPKVIKEIIAPLVKAELLKLGIKDEQSPHLITYKELLRKDLRNIKKRSLEVRKGKSFIYQTINGKAYISWTANPEEIIKEIESFPAQHTPEIKGDIGYKGKVRGKARLILTNNLSSINFNTGDIVIATSTNPNLVPLLKKASAIVTDEGGITCHAAIISREMKKPCIIGTKIATHIIRDGDEIEVDAYKGIVRIIKQVQPQPKSI